MKVRCRTNLDDFHSEQWPEELSCRPVLGDAVRSTSGKRLYICNITHTMYDPMKYTTCLGQTRLIPMLLIELHKRGA